MHFIIVTDGVCKTDEDMIRIQSQDGANKLFWNGLEVLIIILGWIRRLKGWVNSLILTRLNLKYIWLIFLFF